MGYNLWFKLKNYLTNKCFGRWVVLSQTEDYISPQGVHYAQWSRITGIDRHTISKYDDKGFTIGKIIELTKTKQNDWRT